MSWTVAEALLVALTLQGIFIFIIKSLRSYGQNRSNKTVDLQKKLLRAISIQLALPFCIIFIPLCYYTFSTSYRAAINNLMYVLMSTHGLFSTVVMIIVQKPYREFLLALLLLNRRSRDLGTRATNSVNNGIVTNRMF